MTLYMASVVLLARNKKRIEGPSQWGSESEGRVRSSVANVVMQLKGFVQGGKV